MKAYIFKPAVAASVCVALLLPLFIALGFWQLHRAEEKRAIMSLRQHNGAEPPILLSESAMATESDRFRPVVVSGEYDVEHQFLLDNQILNQQAGYWIMTPLRLPGSDSAILVNRGWVPVGSDRTRLPDLSIKTPRVRLTGLLDRFPGVGFKLKGAEVPAPGWPSLVQVLEAGPLAARLGYPLRPYQVLLAADQGDGYARSWHPPDLDPGKNLGYAFQWFSFAAVLVALYLWYGIKPRPAPDNSLTGT